MLTEEQVRKRLAAEIRTAGSLSRWSRREGVDQAWVSRAMNGGSFGPKIEKALGLKSVTHWKETR